MIVLGFNDMSTLVGHFVSSPIERKKQEAHMPRVAHLSDIATADM